MLSIFSINLSALSFVEVSPIESISLLEKSEIVLNNQELSLHNVLQEKAFQPYHQSYLNAGVSQSYVWIKFKLKNSSIVAIDKALVFSSPLLESIALYKGVNATSELKGLFVQQSEHKTTSYYYKLHLEPLYEMTYYVKVHSYYNPLGFSITLQDEKKFLEEDHIKQLITVLLMGMLLALMLYALSVSFYLKDKSYFYYALYLAFIIYQQLTYMGLTQIYCSYECIVFDMKIAVYKVSTMMLSSALFAMHFLKTQEIPWLHRIYKLFLVLIVVEMVVFSLPMFYNMQIIILTGALFIVLNLLSGVISYLHGHKEARLYIVGFSIVFMAYVLMIVDALGLLSIIQEFPNLLMWCSTIEALILSLAFADRYKLLEEEKVKMDRALVENFQNREKIITNEVRKKTAQLHQALDTKALLLKEVHHRIKNNLQIILSMVRLQSDKSNNKATIEKFVNLENRINAIAKTYNLLLPEDDLNAIDMQEYIESLIQDIQESMDEINYTIEIETDIDAIVPLRESVYIGIIINELVTNAYKHAFEGNSGVISISLHKENDVYILIIEDNGKGFIYNKESTSLGLKLIHALVYEQLKGTIEMKTNGLTHYTIRFKI
ncbi:hypothetical protein KKC13_11585 [bacterium]|nr:hypothetical protein [bacterium]MBU1957905.1 hypothetical protein [bacterium]